MAKQTINQGTAPTGAGGDTFRSGSAKLQANDNELYTALGANASGVLPAALPVSNGGTGATTVAAARTNLGLGTGATRDVTTSNTDSTSNRLLKVGDFGLGTYSPMQINKNNDITYNFNGFVGAGGSDGTPFPTTASVINVALNANYQAQFALSLAQKRAFARHWVNGSWTAPYEFLTKENTTTDGNGFVKAASPIVQLFADKIKLNDEAQQQNIEFEKLGTGDYLIKNTSGFAQDGWYIEQPKDANGNVLVAVIYEQLENNDISVKTYKKKFDFETVSIVTDLDNPVDITENRWIDLRLQELPQPEIEIPEPIAPPEFQPTGLAQAVASVMEAYNDTEQ